MPSLNPGHAGQELHLLHDVYGAFRPGVLTALMGASGAGKTVSPKRLFSEHVVPSARHRSEISPSSHNKRVSLLAPYLICYCVALPMRCLAALSDAHGRAGGPQDVGAHDGRAGRQRAPQGDQHLCTRHGLRGAAGRARGAGHRARGAALQRSPQAGPWRERRQRQGLCRRGAAQGRAFASGALRGGTSWVRPPTHLRCVPCGPFR